MPCICGRTITQMPGNGFPHQKNTLPFLPFSILPLPLTSGMQPPHGRSFPLPVIWIKHNKAHPLNSGTGKMSSTFFMQNFRMILPLFCRFSPVSRSRSRQSIRWDNEKWSFVKTHPPPARQQQPGRGAVRKEEQKGRERKKEKRTRRRQKLLNAFRSASFSLFSS